MRLEASIPDLRAGVVVELAEELGLSRSDVIDEALSLFVKAVMEARKGRKPMLVDCQSGEVMGDLSSPTLTMLEWKARHLVLPVEEVEKIAALLEDPPPVSPALVRAMRRHR